MTTLLLLELRDLVQNPLRFEQAGAGDTVGHELCETRVVGAT
ncbi:MAG: hypothetical protein WCG92_24025 [Hyphomicrobiales bacterium]